MGGHAFHWLNTPRISPYLYLKVRSQTTAALRGLFAHVVVPTELPSKTDYGDIDFLVCSPLHAPPSASFDWQTIVSKVKLAFDTPHGRRGHLNPSVMYFAIPAPFKEFEENFWVQVDVKVCEDPALFEWERFQLNYASAAKILGSMVKPLGVNLAADGMYVRVEELEKTNLAGSMVFLSEDPKDVLKVMGLDKRILNEGFGANAELYEYFANSWLFNPAHFAERLKSEKYTGHLEDRSAPWVQFVTRWIPQHYPGPPTSVKDGSTSDLDADLQTWYKTTRVMLREEVFTMFPSASVTYYKKRQACLKEIEECRRRKLLMSVLPSSQEGWPNNPQSSHIVIKPSTVVTAEFETTRPLIFSIPFDILTPPPSPKILAQTIFAASPSPPSSRSSIGLSHDLHLPIHPIPSDPRDTPLLLDPLPRTPPQECVLRPPPNSMSLEARLLCLARWTLFHPDTGAPYLAQKPREKKFVMSWTDSEAIDEVLVQWARDMWWPIWIRQHHVNFVGIWKSRFRKEDEKVERKRLKEEEGAAAKKKAREEVETAEKSEGNPVNEAEKRRLKILGRLKLLNERLGDVMI